MFGFPLYRPKILGLPVSDRKRSHVYLSGKTGSGKSELIKRLYYELLRKRPAQKPFGIVLIDPHGELSQQLLHLKKSIGLEKGFIYIDPFLSPDSRVVINPLQTTFTDAHFTDIYSQELASAIAQMVTDAGLSLQMETLLKPCIGVLLHRQGSDLADLKRFFDASSNSDLMALGINSPWPAHREFFRQGFAQPGYAATKKALYTRLQFLLNNQSFYQLIKGESTVNIPLEMNRARVVVINLARGRLGKDSSTAFGRMVIALVLSTAFLRASQSRAYPHTFLLLDELQHFVSPGLEVMLTEARKFGLTAILANQSPDQLPAALKSAILNNTDIKLYGNNGMPAHKLLSPELGVAVHELQQLQRYYFYLKKGHTAAQKFKVPAQLVRGKGSAYASPQLVKGYKEHLLQVSGYYAPNPDTSSNSNDYQAIPQGTIPPAQRAMPGETPKFTLE